MASYNRNTITKYFFLDKNAKLERLQPVTQLDLFRVLLDKKSSFFSKEYYYVTILMKKTK